MSATVHEWTRASTYRETPLHRLSVLIPRAAIRDPAGEERSPAKEKLLKGRQPAAEPGERDFGLVEWHEQTHATDREARDESPGHHHLLVRRGRLESTTKDKDDGVDSNTDAAREFVGQHGGRDGATAINRQLWLILLSL